MAKKPTMQEQLAAFRAQRAAAERARLDKVLDEFSSKNALAREILRLEHNQSQLALGKAQ
jgi:hypothetical protein